MEKPKFRRSSWLAHGLKLAMTKDQGMFLFVDPYREGWEETIYETHELLNNKVFYNSNIC